MLGDEGQRVLVTKLVAAWERADVPALVGMLTEDVRLTMPPLPIWLDGLAMVRRFLAERIFATPWRLVPATVNGQLAFAAYPRWLTTCVRPNLSRREAMRKVIVYVNLTLDGHLCDRDGGMDWMDLGPAMNSEFADAMRARVDTMLIGRDTYLGFEQHFSASAADPASPAGLVEISRWMVDTPKVVFSRTLTSVSPVSRLATDVPAEVAALTALEGRDIVAFGGVSLVDEYWIKLAPTAIGPGRPLFRGRTPLRLPDSKAWPSGTLTLRYANA